MVKLADVTFDGLPDKAVERLDAYAEVTTEVKNKLESKVNEFNEKRNELIDNALAKPKALVKAVGDKVSKVNDSINNLFSGLSTGADMVQIRDRVKAALGGDRSAMEAIGNDAEMLFATKVLGMDSTTGFISKASETLGKLKVIKDTTEYYFNNNNPDKVNNVLNFIRDIGGSDAVDMVDLGSTAALATSVINEIQDWGVPTLLDDIFRAEPNDSGGYDYGYSEDYRFEVGRSVSDLLDPEADLEFLSQLIVHSGDKALLASNPDLPSQLMSNYSFPTGTLPGAVIEGKKTYSSELALFVSTMDTLKPDWFFIDRNGIKVWNLYFIGTASEDLKTLLCSDPLYREAVLSASNYRMVSFSETARELYPMIALVE